jgi:hypothetical protein
MANSIAYYLAEVGDVYAPSVPKPAAQQWDNYQIYDLYCTDRIFEVKKNGVIQPPEKIVFRDFLAVQAYHPSAIGCDFDAIVRAYP